MAPMPSLQETVYGCLWSKPVDSPRDQGLLCSLAVGVVEAVEETCRVKGNHSLRFLAVSGDHKKKDFTVTVHEGAKCKVAVARTVTNICVYLYIYIYVCVCV